MIDFWLLIGWTVYGLLVLFILAIFFYIFVIQFYSAKTKCELEYLEKSNEHKLRYLKKFHQQQKEEAKETN